MVFRDDLAVLLKKELKQDVSADLEVPPDARLGDYAFPCFKFASKGESPTDLAKKLAKRITAPFLERVDTKGPYLNFFIKREELAQRVLTQIQQQEVFGSSTIGKGKTIVLEYSSPNIAKPFGVGHLRSTVIGNALYHLLSFIGYKVIRVNHLGDWGTQFGKLICAYKHYGNQKELEKEPIQHLFNIYVKFHEEAELRPELEEEARNWFKQLEQGDKDATELWKLFRDLSLDEFKKYYSFLDVEFDSYTGESFYSKMLDEIINEVKKKANAEMSEGALVVDLGELMPPLMVRKSDGASTYHARDLAAAIYRIKTYKPEKVVYVVGAPQRLHFQQLFATLEKMGYPKEKFTHVDFGHFTGMSTRKGNIIFLEEVLDKAIELAKKIINEKNPKLKDKDKVAKMVGLGAVIFSDLSTDRVRDVVFDWNKIMSFEGETGPYLQYAHARCSAVLRKAGKLSKANASLLTSDPEISLIKQLARFPQTIQDAASLYKPHTIAHYLLKVAALFNTFYEQCPILKEQEEVKQARLLIVASTKKVLATGLRVLNIKAPEEM